MNRQQRVQYFQPNYQPAGGVAQNSQNYTSARLNDLTNILQVMNKRISKHVCYSNFLLKFLVIS